MIHKGLPDLALVLADPRRVAELRVEEIPPLLGVMEELRALLWARMIRTPTALAADAGDSNDELLTVPEVAAQVKFTTAYVYEAVRRHELAAVRKGKYVRIRRGDLTAWLEGRRSRGLDRSTPTRDSSPHGSDRGRASQRRTQRASVQPLHRNTATKAQSGERSDPR